MEDSRIMLLVQLIAKLESASKRLEESYVNSEKEKFETSKKELLELQNKINLTLE
jgi:hypothetical protein